MGSESGAMATAVLFFGVIAALIGGGVAASIHTLLYAAYTLPIVLRTRRDKRPQVVYAVLLSFLGTAIGLAIGAWLILLAGPDRSHALALAVGVGVPSLACGAPMYWATRHPLLLIGPILGMLVAWILCGFDAWIGAFVGWHVATLMFTLFWLVATRTAKGALQSGQSQALP